MNSLPEALARASQLDWNLLRAFLAVVDAGSVTGAARVLGISQPTLSRQVAGLETEIGAALFERVARGFRLTAAGEALLPAVRQMQAAAQALSLIALGQAQQMAGTVRLTASEMTSAYVLPKILTRLRRSHPEIQVELVVSNQVENLLERQADIAIRHTHPGQSGLIARSIGEAPIGAFAHKDYLARVGGAIDPARLHEYEWIGLDTSDQLLRGFREAGFPVEREFFPFRCDNHVISWQMALAALGIAFAPVHVAARWPEMQPVLAEDLVPGMPVWLTVHRELRQSARIRAVFDALAEGLPVMVTGQTG